MTVERWERVKLLFEAALDLPPEARSRFVAEQCKDDIAMKTEVDNLLAEHARKGGFLDLAHELTTSTSAPLSGIVLKDRYRIQHELGSGGFGRVYLARDEQMESRPVVIKTLLDRRRHDAWFEQKFADEVRALARIDHPGVVGALDQGKLADGTPFLVMQFVEGVTLRSEMDRGPMALPRIGRIVRQAGQALSAAHDKGIWHRDLKPENIMLQKGTEEYVKLIDFGIAKVWGDGSTADAAETRVAGSHGYMAPEQFAGKPVAASDIYALGVIAYEMTTGRRPFETMPLADLMAAQRENSATNPRTLRPGLPPAAGEAILTALRFRPEDRFSSARDLGRALGDALENVKEEPVAPQLPQARRRFAGVLPLLIFAALAIAVALVVRRHSDLFISEERTLSYTIVEQKTRDGKFFDEPVSLANAPAFPAGSRIRLLLRSPQSGYLYVLDEGPSSTGQEPAFHALFPTPSSNGGSARLDPGKQLSIPEGGYFVFDRMQGVEKLWLVWASESQAELEKLKQWMNPRDRGVIGDAGELRAIQSLVTRYGQPADRGRVLKGRGSVLVYLLELRHE